MAYNKRPSLGQGTMAASEPVVISSDQSAIPVTVSGVATVAAQATLLTELQLKADLTETQPVSLASVPSHAVTNAGTFAVQNSAATPAGTNLMGKVGIDQTTPGTTNGVQVVAALPTGANVIGALTANQAVNVAQMNGVATTMGNGVAGTGVQRVTLASDSTGIIATVGTVTNITNQGNIVDDAVFTPAGSRVMVAGFFADETATDSVDEGDAGAARMTLDRKVITTNYAHTAGGATPYKLVSAATTNATSVKGSAGQVYMITASNVNAAARYLKLYNKASAPVVGTDVPVFTFVIPGNTAGAGTNIPVPTVGLAFSTGIAFALTTEATDAGTTAVAASEIVVNLAYL